MTVRLFQRNNNNNTTHFYDSRSYFKPIFEGYRLHGWVTSSEFLRLVLGNKHGIYHTTRFNPPVELTDRRDKHWNCDSNRIGQPLADTAIAFLVHHLLQISPFLLGNSARCQTTGSYKYYPSFPYRLINYEIVKIARSPVFTHLSSTLNGLVTVRVHQSQVVFQRVFDDLQDVHSSAWYMYLCSSYWFGLWLDCMCVVYVACVTYVCVALRDSEYKFLIE